MARVVAQILMSGAVLVGQAMTRAWQEAIRNGRNAGMTPESVAAAASRVRKQMEVEEARKILGVEANTPWEEVTARFERMFDNNAKSFYLQSKIYRAYERYGQEIGEHVTEEVVRMAAGERLQGSGRGFAASAVEEEEEGSERTRGRR